MIQRLIKFVEDHNKNMENKEKTLSDKIINRKYGGTIMYSQDVKKYIEKVIKIFHLHFNAGKGLLHPLDIEKILKEEAGKELGGED